MGLFNRRQASVHVSERVMLENKYSSSRYNLLLVVIFTLVNVVIAITGGDTYFLFSASIPYYIALFTAIWCGKMPAYYYEGSGLTEADFLPDSVLIVGAVIAILIIALYLLFWVMSKKKVGWLIASLVFFALDSIFMFLIFGISANMIIDALFHVLVIVSLSVGISAHNKLKKLPVEVEPEPTNAEFNDGFDYPEYPSDSGAGSSGENN